MWYEINELDRFSKLHHKVFGIKDSDILLSITIKEKWTKKLKVRMKFIDNVDWKCPDNKVYIEENLKEKTYQGKR